MNYRGVRVREIFNALYRTGAFLGIFAIAFVIWSVPVVLVAMLLDAVTGMGGVALWVSYGIGFICLVGWILRQSYDRAFEREYNPRPDRKPLSPHHPDNFLWRFASRRAKLDEKFWKTIQKNAEKRERKGSRTERK
jgi:hypothetical protein